MLRLRLLAQTALVVSLFCVSAQHAWAQPVEYRDVQNLVSQKSEIENRIGDLQIRINAASAQSTYCSAEERQADLKYLRSLQREAKALAAEYATFKKGFRELAATQTAGPALIAAGIHPDERDYWIVDDNDVQKLVPSALRKADQVEKANIVDCEAKKTAPANRPQPVERPAETTPPAEPKKESISKLSPSPQPSVAHGPTAPLGGPLAGTRCTDKERHDAILRLQEEILRVEEELIPIDGTTKDGRARQLQLMAELDRLKKLMALDCPPLLPPLKPAPPPIGPTTPLGRSYPPPPPKTPTFKMGKPLVATPPKPQPSPSPSQVTGLIYINPFLKLEDDADDALDDLEDAMDACDSKAVWEMIPRLEGLSRAAHAHAEAARQGRDIFRAAEARAVAKDLDEAIEDAKKFRCLIRPGQLRGGILLNPDDRLILQLHNQERAAVGVRPLKWDFKLEWHASAYAEQLAQTGQLVHAAREGRGIERENLGRARIGTSPNQIVRDEWMSEKRFFHAGIFPDVCDGDWSRCAHYTQAIWAKTTDIGCGTAQGGGFVWIDCRYSPGGNKDGQAVGYRDPSTYLGGPLEFNATYSPVLKAYRPVNPDKLEFGDEAVAEWRNFEHARGRCSVPGMSAAIDKLKYYARAAHEHSAEERTKGNEPASGSYDAMARQIDERVEDASLYRDACARNPYRYPERG
jgi:hypothetical protein